MAEADRPTCCSKNLRFISKMRGMISDLEKNYEDINTVYAEGAVEGYAPECPGWHSVKDPVYANTHSVFSPPCV